MMTTAFVGHGSNNHLDIQLGVCSQTDTSNSIIYGGYFYSGDSENPPFTYFSGTTYASSTCKCNSATNTTVGE